MKKLLQWRKTQTAIHHGKMLHYLPEHGVYTYFRYNDQQIVMVLLNKNKIATTIDTQRFQEILKAM